MDYEKEYKEAFERASNLHEDAIGLEDKHTLKVSEIIFPQLKESEDERIRKEIVRFIQMEVEDEIVGNKWLAWLEKQGEQKPTLRIDNSRAKVVFPFKAKVKSTGIVVTIHDGQLSIDGKEWIKYQSDNENGYKVYEPENLEHVCNIELNPTWNEEDERMLGKCIDAASGYYSPEYKQSMKNWLESLKDRVQPQWKPSEEQIQALEYQVHSTYGDSWQYKASKELLEQLKKL